MKILAVSGAVALAFFSLLLLSGGASASDLDCEQKWTNSGASQSCGPPSFPYNTPQFTYNAADDTCRIRVPCNPNACQNDKTVKRSQVTKLNNCNCWLKVGNC